MATVPPPPKQDINPDPQSTKLNSEWSRWFYNAATVINTNSNTSAPTTSKYILQQSDALLPNAQAIGSLASGYMKVTTATGAITSVTSIPLADGGTNANLTASNGKLVYSTASALALLNTANNSTLVTDGSGIPSISSTLPSTVQANITSTGAITSGSWLGTPVALPYGGTNANLTASNGGIFYSTATAGAILSGTSTARQVVLSGSNTSPSWSTATYPNTVSANNILFASSNNTITGLSSQTNSTLVTDGTGVPSISTTLPTAVQGNITSTGTITSGTWSATTIALNKGGTGSTTASGARTNLGFADGTYTPTLTSVANVSSSTAYACQYLQVGNTVTVSGQVDITPTLISTDTQLGISLPVSSTLSVKNKLAGTAVGPSLAGNSGAIYADTSNNRANLDLQSISVASQSFYFTFTYLVT